jgi:hypothetical protein
MTELKSLYATYYNPSNAKVCGYSNGFNFSKTLYSELQHEKYQDHKQYSGNEYNIGLRNVFGRDDFSQEPVGEVFFSERNIKRLQKLIKTSIYEKTNHQFILDEEQDPADLLIAMRAVYQMNGKFIKNHLVHQVKDLNKKLISYIIPDMITEMKQYYGFIKDVNEPLKPIDRPMNVSNAGRKTLPSVTTIWNA